MKKDKHLESQKRLQQILDSIELIEEFTKDENLNSFCADDKLNNAVMMRFVTIGEAIKNVEKEKLKKYDYPWHQVQSFRNIVAHDYFNINLLAVWEIIERDLPELKETITTILKCEF